MRFEIGVTEMEFGYGLTGDCVTGDEDEEKEIGEIFALACICFCKWIVLIYLIFVSF